MGATFRGCGLDPQNVMALAVGNSETSLLSGVVMIHLCQSMLFLPLYLSIFIHFSLVRPTKIYALV